MVETFCLCWGNLFRTYQPSACALRRISVFRPVRKAFIGVPGSDSSSVNSHTMASSSEKPESDSTERVPFKLSTTMPSWRKSAGIERTLRSPILNETMARSSSRRCTRRMSTSNSSATSGRVSHWPTSSTVSFTSQGSHKFLIRAEIWMKPTSAVPISHSSSVNFLVSL